MRDKAAMDRASLLDGCRETQFRAEGLIQEAMGLRAELAENLRQLWGAAHAARERTNRARAAAGPLRSSCDEPSVGTPA
jgi:hypothetical protein